MAYSINLGGWGSVFAVPSSVVDKGLKLASENQLKVLLYILRHSGNTLTDDMVCSALGIHSEDVKDAIEYWCDKGLFLSVGDELIVPHTSAAEVISNAPQHNAEEKSTSEQPAITEAKARLVSRPQKPEQAYVRKRIAGDSDVSFLMDEAATVLGKLLSQPDMATLLMLHDTDGLPVEVKLMLLQHCVQIGKGNMRYIEKTGINWAHDGIVTINLAEEKIKSYSESTSAWNTVASVFGMRLTGSPTQKQLEFAGRWINEWRFSEEMLRLAYERCVDAKGEAKLSYINAILKRWHELSLRRVEDVLKSDAESPNKKRTKAEKVPKESASYDIDAYESKSIFDD